MRVDCFRAGVVGVGLGPPLHAPIGGSGRGVWGLLFWVLGLGLLHAPNDVLWIRVWGVRFWIMVVEFGFQGSGPLRREGSCGSNGDCTWRCDGILLM